MQRERVLVQIECPWGCGGHYAYELDKPRPFTQYAQEYDCCRCHRKFAPLPKVQEPQPVS